MNRLVLVSLLLVFASGCDVAAPVADAGVDASPPDAASMLRDAGSDAPHDVGIDAGADAPRACPTCTARDACHVAGVCDPSTGMCTTPNADDGTSCPSGACIGGVCVGLCSDGRRDGDESGIDCGGTQCATCGVGGACNVGRDCTTGVCDASGHCATISCSDGLRDGTETGIDCGGGSCATCGLGGGCNVDADCSTNACSTTTLTCIADQCMDGRRDGVETDADCGGGGTCPTCRVGGRCMLDSDCASDACSTTTLTCVATQCADARRDGAETDIDCGGGTCDACAVSRGCAIDTDCTSQACNTATFKCVADACADGHRDGMETDVDCGGGSCTACPVGNACSADSDCGSTACDAISLTCVVSPCADHRIDGSETDVDCGGTVCPACLVG